MRFSWQGVLCAALIALVSPGGAMAATVTWYLQGVTFDDGGTASGSFGYDADSNSFSSINLTTTAGSIRSGSLYFAPTGVGNAVVTDSIDPALPVIDLFSERFLLYLGAPMTNAGGQIAINFVQEFTCQTFQCTFSSPTDPGLSLRMLASGATAFITTRPANPMPEPSAAMLVGLGMLAALVTRRRRKSR